MELNKRQDAILQIVKENGPITGEHIAERLNLTRATLRPDLAILTMAGFLDARPRVGYFYAGKKNTMSLTDALTNLKVKDFQSVPVIVSENMTVYDAICHMFLEDVGTLFVADQHNYLQGVLSRKDLLRTSIGTQDLNKIPVHIIMTRMPNIAYCTKNDFLIEAAKKLIDREIDSMPVVNETVGGVEIIGRLTKTNVTKAFISLAQIHEL
ncbi:MULTISPECIES: helix-turn-helix transcriptional regulator [Bacillales]|uniref:Helix-turn-helix transcriptional regulator n=1 Tax=Lysinibacillus louembei TaxID=1470088 RepID=A0ABZ0S494_9BACI|nr:MULTISPECIES: helix-turn-helix transcriptional regulator [Bacillales]MCT6922562.1 helix-turn-helix transcriptional regulator [Metasolibacillus sp.]MCT6939099.1 helix-turn-helix transcriptional regulator [Metasolibacillus sp.]WPK14013.1 helix-turn-helix transcriptional regulator [Lysinibacillus louembei]